MKSQRVILRIVLYVALSLTSACGGGAYFTDDGLRLVHDAKTGEYIGVLAGECKVWDGEKAKYVVTYKVTHKDGRVVEYPQEKVTLNKP